MEQQTQIKAEIDSQLASISALPSMPAIVNRLLSLAYDPDVDIKALAEEISTDPAVTAGVIKMANSAYFRSADRIRSVHEAIVRLGLKAVKDIIILIASRGILQVSMDAYRMEDRALWHHSLLVAELSSRIAKLKKTRTPGDVAFTAGLLHDVGKVVLAGFFRRIHRKLASELEQNPEVPFSDLERQFLGYSQNEIGGRLLQIWDFPEELVEAVTLVNTPGQATKNPELCGCVHVANSLALASGVGTDIGGMHEKLSQAAVDSLKLTNEEMQTLYEAVPEYVESLQALAGD